MIAYLKAKQKIFSVRLDKICDAIFWIIETAWRVYIADDDTVGIYFSHFFKF